MEYLDLNNCPLCGKHLQLKQINFSSAMFICMDVKCPYPVNGDCIIVKRSIENINKTIDLLETYSKKEPLASSTEVSEGTENFTENSLILDLEELLNKQCGYDCYSKIEPQNEVPVKELEEIDFSFKFETDLESSPPCSLELPELDDFLVELFR